MWKTLITKIPDANALEPTVNLHLPTLINVANEHDTHLAGELLSKQSPSMNNNLGTSLFLATPITCAGRRSPQRLSTIKFLIGFISLLVASLSPGTAAQSTTLAWDRNPEPNIARYKIYYGTQSGGPSQSLDVGNVTTSTVSNLNDATKYFFTATAVNTAGLESPKSNEVSHTTPNPMAHVLTVNSGSGNREYVAGRIVTVSANASPAGKKFDRWMDDWVILSNPMIATTTATMPSQNVAITATYVALPTYALSVSNGTGSGSYSAGTQVTVSANAAPAGRQFAAWTGGVAYLASTSSPTTTVAMPSQAVTITATYQLAPTPPNQVTAFLFSEGSGTAVADSSGSGHNGTLFNGPTWTAGKSGKGLSLDGTNDYVSVANPSTLNFGTSNFTIALWIKRQATGVEHTIFSKTATGSWVSGGKELFISGSNNRLCFGGFGG